MKITDLKPGEIIFADGGFDCLKLNQSCEVHQDSDGLYVNCADGQHYLEGQLDFDDGETIVGLAPKPWPTT